MTDAIELDRTHDVRARSWLPSANDGGNFPIQNLPVGVFRRHAGDEAFRGGIAIGDRVVDLAALAATDLVAGDALRAATEAAKTTLNGYAAVGTEPRRALRHALFDLLRDDADPRTIARVEGCLIDRDTVEHAVPTAIGDYTDFFTSIHHATATGRVMRIGLPPLTPNFKSIPLAYHGRASSVGVSGQKVWRPMGQSLPPGAQAAVYGPCGLLDYELELGVFIAAGNDRGTRIALDDVDDHVLGICLLNDWSARDIQMWEGQPLGPFLSKNFATTISPWIVSLDALAPYRMSPLSRTSDDPPTLAYLHSQRNDDTGGFDIQVSASVETAAMRVAGGGDAELSTTTFRHQYWTIAQMIAHHTIGGCQLRAGDLIGTGTISGPTDAEAGALIELTKGGKEAFDLGNGEKRVFLEDGDAVVLRGWCERAGYARIGFGESRGQVLPATG